MRFRLKNILTEIKKCVTILVVIGLFSCVATLSIASENASFSHSHLLYQHQSGQLDAPTATLVVDEGVLKENLEISISSIADDALPKLDNDLTNVTDSFSGYRFLPHGEHFSGKGAKVVLGYDRTKIPSGYTEDDIRTYYYDEAQERWIALERDSVDRANRLIISRTTHFTDMINGVLQVPESPETQGFAPTMMTDLQAADPTAKVAMIEAPQANNRGSANLSYPFEMPPARNGMAPNLALQYSSDAGSGWLGQGWNISTSSITVDTRWGVPRYNKTYESETYLLDGEMLLQEGVGLAHRNLNQTRQSGVAIFYPRKESSFSEIRRIGNSPSEYVWEVIDRKGTKFTYGALKIDETGEGENAKKDTTRLGMLCGSYQGGGRIVISEWRLIRVEEIHGDYVEYVYRQGKNDDVSLYLDSVKAGNAGEEPHTIVTFLSHKEKNIKRNDARYGYLTSSNELLEQMNVYFEGEFLRGYKFGYKEGEFGVDLLTKISHIIDSTGNVFASHSMEYNELSGNSGRIHQSESEASTYEAGNVFGDRFFKRIKEGFGSELSMINGTSSSDGFSVGGGCNAGVGPAFAGISYNYGHSTGKGRITLTDLNGDGLPDKVYSDDNGLHYQKRLLNGGFAGSELISGIKSFAESTSSSHSLNEDVGIGFGLASISATFSQTWGKDKTTTYFSDFNSDGLIDIANNGKVYFNHLNENGTPTFSEYSSHTDNALGKMSKTNIPKVDGFAEVEEGSEQWNLVKDSLETTFPMHDMVRVWKAPFAGTINISGTVILDTLQEGNSDDIDGVTCVIQKNNDVIYNSKLTTSNYEAQCNKNDIDVKSGDFLFFRVNSTYQGLNDKVSWNPSITYQIIDDELEGKVPDSDEYGFSLRTYNSVEGFSKGVDSSLVLTGPCKFVIENNYQKKNQTISGFQLVTTLTNLAGLFSADFPSFSMTAEEIQNSPIKKKSIEYNLEKGDTIKLNFFVSSISPVFDRDLDWTMMFQVTRTDGGYVDSIYVSPYRKMYNNVVKVVDTFMYSPNPFEITESVEGKNGITEVTRICDSLLIRILKNDLFADSNSKTYLFDSEDSVIVREIRDNEKILIEEWNGKMTGKALKFITYSNAVEEKNASVDVEFIRIIKEVFDNDSISIVEETDTTFGTSLYSIIRDKDSRMGQFYRGWGQFAYLGELENGELKQINMADFEINTDKYDEEKIKEWSDSEDNENIGDEVRDMLGGDSGKLEEKFFSMSYNTKENIYFGATTNTYFTADVLSSSRLGNPIIDVQSEFPSYDLSRETESDFGAAAAPIQSSKSFTSSGTLGGGVSIKKFGIGASGSWSKTTSSTLATAMDLNGDGYPDWLSGDDNMVVLYTTPSGVPTESKIHNTIALPEAKAYADAHSVNSSFTNSEGGDGEGKAVAISSPFNRNTWTKTNLAAMAKQRESSENSLSVSGSGNFSNSISTSNTEWCDINGDALPDMIKGNKLYINLGYTFWEAGKVDEIFSEFNENEQIYEVSSSSNGAGMGISIPLKGKANISVGTNASFTSSAVNKQFSDINGDGLPDKLTVIHGENSKDSVYVYAQINKGNDFDTRKYLLFAGTDNLLNKSKATSLSIYANGGATIYFTLFNITPFVNGAKSFSVSRTLSSISDFDGDGFPDLLESDSESKVSVRYSRIGATNKLKSVTNPFGGKFTIDYEHTTPTTDHPGGKWAMSGVTINDGTGLNPEMHTRFHYEEGKHDRRERDFLGFGKVYTYQLDVKDNLADTVRTNLQEFDNSNYFKAGQLIRTLIAEADTMDKLREERTDYNLYSVSDKSITLIEGSLSVDEASAFSAPCKKVVTAYESSEPDAVDKVALPLMEEKYDYSESYANLKTYTHTDLTDGSSYKTEISHLDKLGVPTSVNVIVGSDTLRSITAKYENEFTPWAITQFTQNTGDGEAVTDLEYDHFGNIAKKTLPKNEKGQRMFFSYTYDRKYNMYPTRVTDAFGYRSEMENYDYRYGIPLTVRDMNGYTVQYHIDDLGRTDTIIAPNEQSAGMPFTIAYKYVDAGSDYKSRYAVTDHYDPQHPNDPLRTVTHVDGLGRPHQVKKEAEIYGEGVKYIVSGRVGYDALGREAVAYHPATCGISEEGEIAEFSSQVMKTSLFDALDRPTMEILPKDEAGGGESITKMAYSIATDKKLLKTTTTAPNGDISHSYADGGGQTVLAERFDPVSNEVVPINYYFDAIGQLDSLTDAGGNTTRYTYDMAGRTLSVSHPSVGLTTFKYDIAGNVLEKVTENLRKEEKLIKYEYDYNRLKKVTYPNHPENDVTYTYGGPNARENRVGRLALLEDGSGATEYSYGRMGEVTKQRRTLVIPNVAVATYTTEWNYDSHNRLQEMIYPDGEKIKYFYNLGGQLSSIVGEKEYLYRYIDSTGYDAYEQKVYQRMGNGAVTTYDYSKERRRLKNLKVTSPKVTGGAIMDNTYGYDVMDNIILLVNKATPQIMQNGKSIGGEIEHTYTYDDWSRLVHADGEFVAGSKSATYDLTMGYDKLYNITQKHLNLSQENLQFEGQMHSGYHYDYHYKQGDPFRLEKVDVKSFATETEKADTIRMVNLYEFDGNGNQTMEVANPINDSTCLTDTAGSKVRQYLWDEDNRMLAANVNGFVSNYFYDAVGERTVKISAPDLAVFVNSAKALGNDSTLTKFVGYVSPYLVVSNGGRYTKHIYAGTQRIASKLGDIEAFGADPRRVEYAGANLKEVDFGAKYKKQTSALFARYDSLGVEHRPNTLNDYVGGQSFCCGEKELVSNNQTGDNTFETPDYEHLIFFYHPDHLGSTSLVTDNSGNVVQSVAYIPYGEVFIEERNGTWNTPYLFNGKELDEETGLYYYGARYLNPTNGMWLSVDPLWEKNIDASPYSYCHGNPINKIDVMGLDDSFYCEDGSKIGSVKSETNNYYVVRTTQTTDEMYAESSIDQKGNSNPISQSDALRAKLIANSACSGDGVFSKEEIPMHLFTQIPNQEEFDAAMKFIGDNGKGGTFGDDATGDRPYRNHREYAFNLIENEVRIGNTYVNKGYKTEGTFTGEVRDASKSRSVSTAYRNNHTHPSGVGSEGDKWQQAPSATDISNSSYRIRRVWGMGNKTMYMFNNKGVQATIPYSIYRR